ncbi:GTPase ObgE [Yunchengibacter salinarum]|uniref:GTPase ObgE n=1 Tax=Yunchengibacter salinarum TaxID=3133399 RepID=UPI0035B57091
MKFVDQSRVFLKSGPGGNGCMSFRREKYVEFGGPNGGDGGRGGHVIMEAVDDLNTLVDFRYQRHFKAQKGGHGQGKDMTGAAGKDLLIKVPKGTQVFDADGEFLIADLDEPGKRLTILEGGHGGFGNAHFKSSTNRAPRRTTPGGPGEEMWVVLKLKLMADAGLLGLPNAGKSTFLAATSRARPKIADYPFTTLHPQLGVVGASQGEFVLADIPGLIEGASEGVGLGHQFLGHVERCRVLLHLIDGTAEDVVADWRTVRHELEAYDARFNVGLLDKPVVTALTKTDALDAETVATGLAALKQAGASDVRALSAVSGDGVRPVVDTLKETVDAAIAADHKDKVDTGAQGHPQDHAARHANGANDDTPGWSPV